MFLYTLKSGFKNLGTKKLFSIASIATIACSVFVFCIFFAVFSNIQSAINTVESTIGIQVFFDANLSDNQIQDIANTSFMTTDVKEMRFISGSVAWENFKKDYFGDKEEELSSAFENDNPLLQSASYEILLHDIERQEPYVKYLYTIDGVRQVNYSSSLVQVLIKLNDAISYFSFVLILILIIIAVILISNTITVASQYRIKENEIMRLIGATNFMIKAPFVVEGLMIGLFGAIVPIIVVCLLYNTISKRIIESSSLLLNIFRPIPLINILSPMCAISFLVSIVVCTVVSFITISRNIKI